MQGRRLPDDPVSFKPGDYGKVEGIWHARAPRGHLGNLAGHEVTEHEDNHSLTLYIDHGRRNERPVARLSGTWHLAGVLVIDRPLLLKESYGTDQ